MLLLKRGHSQERGAPFPSPHPRSGNSLVEESEEISHDHDDHTGKGDEDLLDLVHPLSWALQFCNVKGLLGCLPSSESHGASISDSHLLDQPPWLPSVLGSDMCAWPGQSEHRISLAAGVGARRGTNQNQLELILGSLGWRNPERGPLLKPGRRKSGAAGCSQGRSSFLEGKTAQRGRRQVPADAT